MAAVRDADWSIPYRVKMNVIDYITITCNIKKWTITDYIQLHDKMQSITTD
jgi:hypothetical protein